MWSALPEWSVHLLISFTLTYSLKDHCITYPHTFPWKNTLGKLSWPQHSSGEVVSAVHQCVRTYSCIFLLTICECFEQCQLTVCVCCHVMLSDQVHAHRGQTLMMNRDTSCMSISVCFPANLLPDLPPAVILWNVGQLAVRNDRNDGRKGEEIITVRHIYSLIF